MFDPSVKTRRDVGSRYTPVERFYYFVLLIISRKLIEKGACEHDKNFDENITPKTSGCEECEKEGTEWVALRMCLSCGHVGCCDSSVGLHATKHFQKTNHPVMIALPDKSWKWCYIDKEYIQ